MEEGRRKFDEELGHDKLLVEDPHLCREELVKNGARMIKGSTGGK